MASQNLHISVIVPGDVLIADDGFTCVEPGPVRIYRGDDGDSYFECSHGRHYLIGQLDAKGYLIGLSKNG